MGRELLVCEVMINRTQSILCSTSHLESLPNNSQRRFEQLKESFFYIEKLAQGTYLVKVNDVTKGYTIIKN